MKVFVVLDTDIGVVYGVYGSLSDVMTAAINFTIMNENYRSFLFTKLDGSDTSIIFIGDDSQHAGHWMITRHNVEEG